MSAALPACLVGFLATALAAEPPSEEPDLQVHVPSGPLAGLIVYLSAGHGRLMHRTADGRPIAWSWQRDPKNGVREDEWTAAFVVNELAGRLEAAGATVLALRERDPHAFGWTVDDADAGFSLEGSAAWAGASLAWGPGWRDLDDTAKATWTFPPLPEGTYRVYARWVAGPDRSAQARYLVRSRDTHDAWTVDQRVHGAVWWPLGEVTLAEGEEASVTLDGPGGRLSADSVRIGGGAFAPGPEEQEVPIADVAPAHRQATLGGPAELLWLADGTESSDIRFRARWVSWASPAPEEAIYLSIHTNAGRGRGTELYVGAETSPPMAPLPESLVLAASVRDALPSRLAPVVPGWPIDAVGLGDFSEVSPRWQTLPAVLVEVGFHDHPTDAGWLKRADFRAAFADGLVDGVVRWRTEASDAPIEFLPVVEGKAPGDRL